MKTRLNIPKGQSEAGKKRKPVRENKTMPYNPL